MKKWKDESAIQDLHCVRSGRKRGVRPHRRKPRLFLWGYVKPKVCQADSETRGQMKETAASVFQDMMGNFRHSFQSCITAQGGLFRLRLFVKDFLKVYSFQSFMFHMSIIVGFDAIND